MSKYELIYYDSRGYAEPIRILFSLAGKQITFHRFNLKSETSILIEILEIMSTYPVYKEVYGT